MFQSARILLPSLVLRTLPVLQVSVLSIVTSRDTLSRATATIASLGTERFHNILSTTRTKLSLYLGEFIGSNTSVCGNGNIEWSTLFRLAKSIMGRERNIGHLFICDQTCSLSFRSYLHPDPFYCFDSCVPFGAVVCYPRLCVCYIVQIQNLLHKVEPQSLLSDSLRRPDCKASAATVRWDLFGMWLCQRAKR
jgi:hypothetical protein